MRVRKDIPLRSRGGLTLFEVVLSLSIFIGAMAAIGQLISNGVRSSLQARMRSEAAILGEAKLQEIVAGVMSPVSTQAQVFPTNPDWTWQLTVGPGPVKGLLSVRVVISHLGQNNLGKLSESFTRYMRDPTAIQAALDEQAQRDAENKSNSDSSSSSSSGSGS